MRLDSGGLPSPQTGLAPGFLTRNPPFGLVTNVAPKVMFSFTSVTLGIDVLTGNRREGCDGGKTKRNGLLVQTGSVRAHITARASLRSADGLRGATREHSEREGSEQGFWPRRPK